MTKKSFGGLYAVFNDDHIERDDENITEMGWDWFTDLDAAQFALRDYLLDVREETNLRSKKAGAEDRDHLLSCIITTLAMCLPAFADVGTEKACQAISQAIDPWLEVPKKEVEASEKPVPAPDVTSPEMPWIKAGYTVEARGPALRDLPHSKGSIIGYARFDEQTGALVRWAYGRDKGRDSSMPGYSKAEHIASYPGTGGTLTFNSRGLDGVIYFVLTKPHKRDPDAPIGLQRNPKNDYDFARLNLAVYAGEGACVDTVRMVFQGLIDINSEVEWVEDIGDGEPVKHRDLVCVKQIVELDDLSLALVCEMLHSNGNPRHETRVLRFSSITNIEVG